MSDINNITIAGRLTKDIETSIVGEKQTTIGKFGIANNIYNGKEDYTSFFDCVVWGKKAEVMAKYLSKGSQLIITGQIKQERFETRDGNKASKSVVVVSDFQFMGNKPKSDETPF